MKKTDIEKNKGLKIANRQAFDAARKGVAGGRRGASRQADSLNPLIRRMLARAGAEGHAPTGRDDGKAPDERGAHARDGEPTGSSTARAGRQR